MIFSQQRIPTINRTIANDKPVLADRGYQFSVTDPQTGTLYVVDMSPISGTAREVSEPKESKPHRPKEGRGRHFVYPHGNLKVGESCVIECGDRYKTVRCSIAHYAKRYNRLFEFVREENILHVKRIG